MNLATVSHRYRISSLLVMHAHEMWTWTYTGESTNICHPGSLRILYMRSILSVPLRGDIQGGRSLENGAYTCGISVVLLARLGLLYSRKPTALAGAECEAWSQGLLGQRRWMSPRNEIRYNTIRNVSIVRNNNIRIESHYAARCRGAWPRVYTCTLYNRLLIIIIIPVECVYISSRSL